MPKQKLPRGNCHQCCRTLANSKPAAKFCSNTCQMEAQYDDYISKWRRGAVSGTCGDQVSRHVRRFMLDKYDHRCGKCGWSEVHPVTKLRPLTINHIDGDSQHTVERNLEVLCPNCHALTPSYGSLNRGRGRAVRRKNYRAGKLLG